ncbi:hypothetical protein JX265_006822 [Neoarthrinium moseri]|uniref:Major facilitator superfamily (MFS) profile domain-containing protein n=1 Tax=Neoarthrinium moseri TaxID=1658444 RepID=A0A9P9WL43_9PEZI|nr:hypothetical protein JX265_006822 [Neoarthrinium moseri]
MTGSRYEALDNAASTLSTTSSVRVSEHSGFLRDAQVDDGTKGLAVITSPEGLAALGSGAASSESEEQKRRAEKQKVVAWRDLPKKKQLFVITMTRLSEPLVQTSLQAYMYYQLKWFDPSLPDSVIASQAGVLHASFTAAQFVTAMLWGRVADTRVVSCIGFGFSTSFHQALFFRCLGGITNGNIGVLRTMISEVVREKKYQSRAFLLLPMTFNIGIIVGPVLGGILSDPAASYPNLFGQVLLFRNFPYALPNLVSAGFLFCALVGVVLLLEETHDALRDKADYGRLLASKLVSIFRRDTIGYTPLHSRDSSITVEMSPILPETDHGSTSHAPPRRRYISTLPFRRIFTRNVSLTLLAHFFLAFHLGTFNSLWFTFLSTPVYNPEKPTPEGFRPSLPFHFNGGLGLPARNVGIAMAMLGAIGITMQLFLYPRLSSRFGNVRMWRVCLFLFPVAYIILPYLSVIPSTTPPPSQKTGVGIWVALAGVLFIQVTGRTFALPAQTILVNNCTPHPSVLGTVHGIGQSVSSFARTVGPISGGFLFGIGHDHGLIGGVFWSMAGIAIFGLIASFWVKEGDGHEIWLEGDEEDEADA